MYARRCTSPGIAPTRPAGTITRPRLEKLVTAVREVLAAAIEAGGSTLKDYARPSGELGYFAKQWRVYGREGEPCACGGLVERRVDSAPIDLLVPGLPEIGGDMFSLLTLLVLAAPTAPSPREDACDGVGFAISYAPRVPRQGATVTLVPMRVAGNGRIPRRCLPNASRTGRWKARA
jgi:hypothetical protein